MLILLNGKPRSGKDTAANYLVSKYGFNKFTLAKHLKYLTLERLNLSVEWLDFMESNKDVSSKENLVLGVTLNPFNTFREAIMNTASYFRALEGQDYFVRVVCNVINLVECTNDTARPNHYVVSDLGFTHELDYFKTWAKINKIDLVSIYIDSKWVNNNLSTKDSRRHLFCDYTLSINDDRGEGSILKKYEDGVSSEKPELYSEIDRLLTTKLGIKPNEPET